MATSIYPEYPPCLSPSQQDYLVASLKDWSITNGLAVRPSPAFIGKDADPAGVLAVTAPVTLFPSLFPRTCFEEAMSIQGAYNELYVAISQDVKWLDEIMQELVEVDDFIARLWEIHLAVNKEGYVQDLSLGLFRSDYMIHIDPSLPNSAPQIRQVEFNTIASSFGGLSSQVSLLHRHLLRTSAYPPNANIREETLPPNESISSLSRGLMRAHSCYGSSKSSPTLPLCIAFIVQSPERNIFDQRHLEYDLQCTHKIPVYRIPFSSVLSDTCVPLENPRRPLIYRPPHHPSAPYEVSTVYFRAGYGPSDYPSSESWLARSQIERSAAVKCPSILTHLAGCKKVQQVLATPSSPHLARFLPNSTLADRVRNTFAAIYPMNDSPAGLKAKSIALDPEESNGYVLKPQREGGGNNIYRCAIPQYLRNLGDEKNWRGHILMKIIEPPDLKNSIFREGSVKTGAVVGELGVYGVALWRNDGVGKEHVGHPRTGQTIENFQAGYLLRTKGKESEEGGVAAGFGSVDSVCLIDV